MPHRFLFDRRSLGTIAARGPGRPAVLLAALAAVFVAAGAPPALADEPAPAAKLDGGGPPIEIHRTNGEIRLDGDLSDPGWQGIVPIDTWWETNIAESGPPPVRNLGYLAYDDKFLYAGFKFFDPEPQKIRAPIGDRDNISGETDYGGIIVDPDNDGRTGVLFLANAHGVQYDATNDDTTGNEDSSPDFFWDSAAKSVDDGWILEMRIPFSSLRYRAEGVQTWRIMLYRNWPRGRQFQMFSTKLPRGGNCFVCWSNVMTGLEGLPEGGHFVIAPYATASRDDSAPLDPDGDRIVGEPVESGPLTGDGGLDFKWTPNANTALDLALNPDFSQVESDVTQISSNERFALFYPEKRPFFLESVDLFSTPLQAVHTRTISSPRWGARATGRFGETVYTALVVDDRGGGQTIVPGVDFSALIDSPSGSTDFIGRMRHDLGSSFVSLLATVRENDDGSFNRVLGPDFQWRPNDVDSVTGQLIYSSTREPDRTDLYRDWDGHESIAHAGFLSWSHQTETWDWYAQYQDLGDGFRSDLGFGPQVGFREEYFEAGYTFRPAESFLSRIRVWGQSDYTTDRNGELIQKFFRPGAGMDGRWNSFFRLWLDFSRIRSGEGPESGTLPRRRFQWIANISPSRVFALFEAEGSYGTEVDFANGRPGRGGTINTFARIRPTDHLEFNLIANRQWLDVDPDGRSGGPQSRLFTATVGRLRAQYSFTSKMYVRLIGQYVETTQDPALYLFPVDEKLAAFSGSFLFSYKLNWQTVLFVGYGDDREFFAPRDELVPVSRSFFAKLSYAFQL